MKKSTLVFSLLLAATLQAAPVDFRAEVKRLGVDAPTQVTFDLDPSLNDAVKITAKKSGALTIQAGKRVNLLPAYGYYLKHHRGSHWSWSASRMAPIYPMSDQTIDLKMPWDYRVGYNYCTLSYTSAMWGTPEWVAEIDRMALNGTTHLLVQAGLEKVWKIVLTEIGYPKDKIATFIPSPAAAAWWNMGNLEGHLGPLSQAQINSEAALGRAIVSQMKRVGMEPIIQAFVGLVPHDLDKYPTKLGKVRLVQQGKWVANFQRPAVLDPTSEAYQKLADIWYKAIVKVYGIMPKTFSGDLFHEGGRTGGINVTKAAHAIEVAMQRNSPEAKWILQHWHGNPSQALLKGLSDDKVVILSLCRDMAHGNNPKNRRSFFGKPWVWCELANFGGNQGLYGGQHVFAKLGTMNQTKEANKWVGLGLLSEGTETNPCSYELFFDRFWMARDKVMTDKEVTEWYKGYITRRYGFTTPQIEQAYAKLHQSVYNPKREQEGCTESIICARPNFSANKASTWSSGNIYYNPADVLEAFELLLDAGKKNRKLAALDTYRYDLIDLGRQVSSDYTRTILPEIRRAYNERNLATYNRLTQSFIQAIAYADRLMGTHSLWRFGKFYEQALRKASTSTETANTTQAIKTLFTTWTGRIDGLNDYAHRQMQGLFKDYYAKRWQLYFDTQRMVVTKAKQPQQANQEATRKVHDFEKSWAKQSTAYTSKPQENTLHMATVFADNYLPQVRKTYKVSDTQASGTAWTLYNKSSQLTFDITNTMLKKGQYKAVLTISPKTPAKLTIKRTAFYKGDICSRAEETNQVVDGTLSLMINVDAIDNALTIYRLVLDVQTDAPGTIHGSFDVQPIK